MALQNPREVGVLGAVKKAQLPAECVHQVDANEEGGDATRLGQEIILDG